MPEDLSSLIGGSTGATPETGVAGKKKLKKQGDYWVDEQGNQYLDAEGTQPVKGSEKSVMSLKDFISQTQSDPQSKSSLFTGEVGKRDLSTGGKDYSTEPKTAQQEAQSIYEDSPMLDVAEKTWAGMGKERQAKFGSKEEFLKQWKSWSRKDKNDWGFFAENPVRD